MSTPMILVAPAAWQPIIAARPTAPSPNTAQVEPGSTWSVQKEECAWEKLHLYLIVQCCLATMAMKILILICERNTVNVFSLILVIK